MYLLKRVTNMMEVQNNTPPANEDKNLKMSNPAWADAMNKILKTKKRKGKSLVLSKAKLISATDVSKIKQEREHVEESFEVVDKGGQKVAIKIDEIKEEVPDLNNIEPKIPKRIKVCIVVNLK